MKSLNLPDGYAEIGDCMVKPPGGTRTIPAKLVRQRDDEDIAIDIVGNHYRIVDHLGDLSEVTFEFIRFMLTCALCGERVVKEESVPDIFDRTSKTHIVCFNCREYVEYNYGSGGIESLTEIGEAILQARCYVEGSS